MEPGPQSHLRIARPSRDLNAAERFWTTGLGLEVLYRAAPHSPDENALLMLGWPAAAWHLELVHNPELVPERPSEEDLLVLYLDGPIDDGLSQRLLAAGGTRVQAHNPYWERWGQTFADPDGYRLVLSHRSWP